MDWAPERPLTGIKYSYTAKTFFNVALTLPYLSLFLYFPLSLIVPPRRKSRRWPTSQPHLFIQCRLRTGHLRLTAAISACWLANMIAQRTVGKLWVNPYLSKREPPGTNSQRTKPSTRFWLLIINLWSPSFYHGRTWKPCSRQTKQQIHKISIITLGKWDSGYFVQGLL